MAQMRKEAANKRKIEFAKVKKVNELYLAEDESRTQDTTYQRLYTMGTNRVKSRK